MGEIHQKLKKEKKKKKVFKEMWSLHDTVTQVKNKSELKLKKQH